MIRKRVVLVLLGGGLVAAAVALSVHAALAQAPKPPPVAAAAPDEAASPSPFKNVKVLTHVRTKQEMRDIMKKQAASLGVKCAYCHVPGKFDLDDKKEKLKARKMIRMVQEINKSYFSDPDDPKVTCFTCHSGHDEPENEIPAALLTSDTDTFEAVKEPGP